MIAKERNIINTKMGVKGVFAWKKFKADGTVTGEGEFQNLILNNGLDLMATNSISEYLGRVHVGKGTTAPTNTDVALETPLVSVNRATITATNSGGTPDWFNEYTAVFNFGEGVAAGNLTELGISTTANSFFSRALFKDEFDVPTTITVLSDEFLTITYKFRIYMNTTDVTGVVNLEGIDYDYTIRPRCVISTPGIAYWGTDLYIGRNDSMYAMEGGIVAFTSISGGSGATRASVDTAVYTPGNYYLDFIGYWAPGIANFGTGIGSVYYMCQSNGAVAYGHWQIGFSPKIPKTNTKKLDLTLRVSWDRI